MSELEVIKRELALHKEKRLEAELKLLGREAGVLPDRLGLFALTAADSFGYDEAGKLIHLDGATPTYEAPERAVTAYRKTHEFFFVDDAKPTQDGSESQKIIKRASFDRMGPAERTAYIKSGGRIVD